MSTETVTHQPVMLPRADYPDQIGQTGCTCGFRPTKPAKSSRLSLRPWQKHLTDLGIDAPDHANPVYPEGQGARSGLTWDEARAAGLDTRP